MAFSSALVMPPWDVGLPRAVTPGVTAMVVSVLSYLYASPRAYGALTETVRREAYAMLAPDCAGLTARMGPCFRPCPRPYRGRLPGARAGRRRPSVPAPGPARPS